MARFVVTVCFGLILCKLKFKGQRCSEFHAEGKILDCFLTSHRSNSFNVILKKIALFSRMAKLKYLNDTMLLLVHQSKSWNTTSANSRKNWGLNTRVARFKQTVCSYQ